MDPSESPSYNPDPKILGNLYISSISLVAILLGSKTSLKIWRALQVHDNLTKGGKDIPASACKSKHRKTAALALTFFILAFFSFEGTWIYGLIAEDAIAARVGAGALTAFIATVCLTQPLIDCVADLHVTRWAGKKGNHYIARSIPAHRKRAIFAAVTGLSIAIYQAIAPSSGIFSAMMTGLVYRYASRPSPIYKGWLSIRGMVIMLGSMMVLMIVLTASLVFAIVQTGSVGDASGQKNTFGMTDDDDMGMQGLQLNGISLHILNGLIGMLIALVFRYEFSLTDFPVQLNVSNGSPSAEAEPLLVDEKKDEVNPQSDSIPTPSQRITVTVFNIPKFRAPLFALSLGTLALVHVPALLLTSSASSWVTKVMTEDGGSFASIASFILVEMPPQVWGAIFVPLVVILATYLREDGCQLWRYSEQWVVVKEKETSAANADVENTVTPTPTPVNASVDVKEGELVDVKA